ncbi:MAG: hypothetical protein ACN6QH_25580 [Pseudomonas sp.]
MSDGTALIMAEQQADFGTFGSDGAVVDESTAVRQPDCADTAIALNMCAIEIERGVAGSLDRKRAATIERQCGLMLHEDGFFEELIIEYQVIIFHIQRH